MSGYWSRNRCILSKFYIKPQRSKCYHVRWFCCILSKFYIKPQLPAPATLAATVVSYRNSTSNHNVAGSKLISRSVVSYRNSTSNHNIHYGFLVPPVVVSYRNSTSNHNIADKVLPVGQLYLIEILHQTTTVVLALSTMRSCILSKFYIKPQPTHLTTRSRQCCILSKFYIKPQLSRTWRLSSTVVSYRNSTSNHNVFR